LIVCEERSLVIYPPEWHGDFLLIAISCWLIIDKPISMLTFK
jgi:hypothetical protein